MRVGVLYICIGQYNIFWKDFYLSAERFLLQGSPCNIREYFVFTDSPSIYGENENEHIHRFYQKDLGWPDNTMMRFKMFLSIKEQLQKNTDYLFFFNANLRFMAPVGEEILPSAADNSLVGALHPVFFKSRRWNYPYERRRCSATYIPYWKGEHYYQGALEGGATNAFLHLCETCNGWLEQDKKNGIIPDWHDESALNRYFLEHRPKLLDSGYIYPDGYSLPFEMKIKSIDKSKYFPRDKQWKVEGEAGCAPGKRFIVRVLNKIGGRCKNGRQ